MIWNYIWRSSHQFCMISGNQKFLKVVEDICRNLHFDKSYHFLHRWDLVYFSTRQIENYLYGLMMLSKLIETTVFYISTSTLSLKTQKYISTNQIYKNNTLYFLLYHNLVYPVLLTQGMALVSHQLVILWWTLK